MFGWFKKKEESNCYDGRFGFIKKSQEQRMATYEDLERVFKRVYASLELTQDIIGMPKHRMVNGNPDGEYSCSEIRKEHRETIEEGYEFVKYYKDEGRSLYVKREKKDA